MSIINTYDQLLAAREAGLPDVAVLPRKVRGGRTDWRDGWKVWRPGFNLGTETDLFSYDYGYRVFSDVDRNSRAGRAKALAAANQWAGLRYKVEGWVRNPMGAYVDRRVNEKFPLPRRERK
jgi:hypothetical protein